MGWKDNKAIEYFISARSELKKVAWPTRQEVTRFSVFVIAISLAIAAFIGVLDYVFTFGLELIIK
jgi:preprotein translocase subunit SecE